MPIEPEPFEEGLPHRFLTLKQVAAMLATSEAQVNALVRAGDLPAIKIGGREQWRVENRQLDQRIKAQYRKTRPVDGSLFKLDDPEGRDPASRRPPTDPGVITCRSTGGKELPLPTIA